MYKNQLQELAQRSCFNLPAYTCIREGPDHAPRFKAVVNFNGEAFESPAYCTTLRQAEHSAAEVALNALAGRGPNNSLAARILDETGVYKNLLQEVSQRVGASLPIYTTFRSGLGHLPVFTCTVELAGVIFTGDPAKNKKQAEKNAAMAAWLSLKKLLQQSDTDTYLEMSRKDELEHVTVARALQRYLIKARLARVPFPIKFPTLSTKPANTQPPQPTSKLLPLICSKTAHQSRPVSPASTGTTLPKFVQTTQSQPATTVSYESRSSVMDNFSFRPQKFPAAGGSPYIPVRHCNPHHRIAPPVTIRSAVPVFSAPPLPPPQPSYAMRPPALSLAPPVRMKQAVPTYAAPVRLEERPLVRPATKLDEPRLSRSTMTGTEEPPICRTISGRLEESSVSKLLVVQVEEPLGRKSFPIPIGPKSDLPKFPFNLLSSEIFTAPPESIVSKISSPPANSKASGEASRIAAQDKSQESSAVEDLKNLKI